MYQILAVDDSKDVLQAIEHSLGYQFRISKCGTIQEAEETLKQMNFDLIILDLGLPDGNGLTLCSALKNDPETRRTPLIMLTGKQKIEDKVMGFSAGADDYIVKPFHPQELKFRVEARLREIEQAQDKDEMLSLGDLNFDIARQRVLIEKEGAPLNVSLTTLEFRLLLFLARHRDQVLSRSQLLNAVWGDDINVYDRTIDTHISHIRKKIQPSQWTIASVHGAGYRFTKE